MAQTKRKRRRKHKGTPAGTVVSSTKPKAKGKDEAKVDARARREARMNRRPTWRGAVQRAAIAAVIFGVLLASPLFSRPIGQAAVLTVFSVRALRPAWLGHGQFFCDIVSTRRPGEEAPSTAKPDGSGAG